MPRADEHEGELNDTETKRQHDRMEAEARRILRADIAELSENEAFTRWFQKFAFPAIAQNFPVNNGSALAHFMGKRELILDMIADMDKDSPGFMHRMLGVRDAFERTLLAAASKEQ